MGLFDEREASYQELTSLITNAISDTVIAAILHLLVIPQEHLVIDQIDIVETALLLSCRVTYDPTNTTSEFLQALAPVEVPQGITHVERVMRIGIPMSQIFDSSEEISSFLLDVSRPPAEPQPVEVEAQQEDVSSFDPTILTKEQVHSMLFFQQHTKGVVQ